MLEYQKFYYMLFGVRNILNKKFKITYTCIDMYKFKTLYEI